MQNYNYTVVRQKYLDYMKKNGHAEIPAADLVPENDPSILFVNSGMFPLVPFLCGETHPLGTRLANVQRCVRTGDIDDVGDPRHCTVFEMLGNWSLNDYFKKEAINFTIEFYIKELGLDINNIYGSAFEGADGIPKDEESIQIWKDIFKSYGIEAKVGKGEKIQLYGFDKNWWGLAGGGPCGPCSECFYDTGKEPCGPDCHINCDCGKYVEIGNDVLMQFYKEADGTLRPLGRHNVDFGGGLVRIVTMLQKKETFFETDIYSPIMDVVKNLSKVELVKSQRIIVDHIQSAVVIIMDGVVPGRTQQGYILRRLIRRAVRHSKLLGIEGLFTKKVGEVCISQFSPIYPQLKDKTEKILQILEEEEKKFAKTLSAGLKELDKIFKMSNEDKFDNSGQLSFKLYETYGFPPEMFLEELKTKGFKIDDSAYWENHNVAFKKAQQEHQDQSRTAAKGLFKGGLADTSDTSKKYHTAQHLLLAAMRKIIGESITQKGSNITTERLRFDFPSIDMISDENLMKIEDLVNEQIMNALPVSYVEMPKDEALKIITFAAFADKYPDIVKVYSIGEPGKEFSKELCNGPHASNTSELGKFKIVKQENIGAGLKRIKAVLE